MDISQKISEYNSHLNRIRLQVTGTKVYFRAIFPPKPGETEHKRTRIASGCNTSLPGLKLAYEKAKVIDAELVLGTFDWSPHLRGKLKQYSEDSTIEEWINKFEEEYWLRREKDPNKSETFRKCYLVPFKRLPKEQTLLLGTLIEGVKKSVADSASRRRDVDAFISLAKLANFDSKDIQKLRSFRGNYSYKSVEPYDLPTDEQIYEVWSSIKPKIWKWVYSVVAIWGIRPHEIFRMSIDHISDEVPTLEILPNSKTGKRKVYPCRSNLWKEFTPEIPHFPQWDDAETLANSKVGSRISNRIYSLKVPYTLYSLRHAYARRMFLRGFGSDFIAKSMGHTEVIHKSVYRAWWGDSAYDKMYEQVMKKWED